MASEKNLASVSVVFVEDVDTRIDPFDIIPPPSLEVRIPKYPVVQVIYHSDLSIDAVPRQSPTPSEPFQPPPRDSGKAALLMLLAVLILDSSTYGILLAYGVFQEYYHDKFVNHGIASWIGVLSGGIPFLGAPAITWCCQRYTWPRQYYIWFGLALCILSLLVSAFLNSLPGLIVTQGLLYGIGALFVSIPELVILNTWFDRRRGIAYGAVFAAADLFGVAYTFLATELLQRYSFRTTMLVFTAMTFVLGIPATMFLRERADSSSDLAALNPGQKRKLSLTGSNTKSVQRSSTTEGPFSPSIDRKQTWPTSQPRKRYYQRGVFYIFTIINFLHASAWYLPFIYLPSFVTQLGYSRNSAAVVLAIGNFAMIIGDLSFGVLSDKLHVNLLLIASTAVSSASAFVLWGLVGSGSKSLGAAIAFMALFSCFGGGIVALWARMGTVFGEKDAQMVYSTLCFGRGLGGILSGPISQVLLKTETPKALRNLGRGPYGGVIMFVGMCMAGAAIMSACAILALWWKKEKIGEDGQEQAKRKSFVYIEKQ